MPNYTNSIPSVSNVGKHALAHHADLPGWQQGPHEFCNLCTGQFTYL